MNMLVYVVFNLGVTYCFNSAEGIKMSIHNVVPKISDIPYHVLIVYKDLYCSGSLIASKVVVTAATCLHAYSSDAVVKVGSNTVTGFGQIIPVQGIKIHEYYRHQCELDNDIALLLLKDHVLFSENVKKVRLIDSGTSLYDGYLMQVSGWGGNNLPSKYSNSLILSQMVIIDKSECQKIHGPLITASNFCAVYNYDERLSDNGGGAVYNDALVGVLSYGAANVEEPFTAIFTNISYFYRWMKINTQRLLTKYCTKNSSVVQLIMNSNEYE